MARLPRHAGGHRTCLQLSDNTGKDILSSLAIFSQQRLQRDCGSTGFSGDSEARGLKGSSFCEVRKGESESGGSADPRAAL